MAAQAANANAAVLTVEKRKKPWTKERVGSLIADIILYVFIFIMSMMCLLPFIHILSKSISSEAAVAARRVVLLPVDFTMAAYTKLFADASILRSFWVSVVVTVAFTAVGMVLTTMCAYVMSRPGFQGKAFFNYLIMITLYFSAGIIPEYLLMSWLHMLETWWCMILPLSFSAYNMFIMKNYFQSNIPVSLVESAELDGASHFTILGRIVVPLSGPIMASIGLFYAVGRWNAYMDAMFYIKQNTVLRPLQLKLYYLIVAANESFQLEGGTVQTTTNPEVLKAACVMFATVPIMCIYPFLQKYFVKGVMVGAVKG